MINLNFRKEIKKWQLQTITWFCLYSRLVMATVTTIAAAVSSATVTVGLVFSFSSPFLAAYYTILDHLADDTDGETRGVSAVSYSRSEPPQADNIIEYNFTCSALKDGLNGRNSDVAYMILDELMNAVRVTNPELYRFAVRKLNA